MKGKKSSLLSCLSSLALLARLLLQEALRPGRVDRVLVDGLCQGREVFEEGAEVGAGVGDLGREREREF
jgi:hypothetical protein